MSYAQGVMIVDDSSFMRLNLRSVFEEFNIPVIGEATNGLEALEKYKELKPRVVLMDVVMPELDGIGGVKKIIEYDRQARVIMLSSMGSEDKVTQALEAGALNFISKPFEDEKLVELIRKEL
jgi:two-component system, chemotaxis family, chemotaxis protein CheY